MDQIDTRIEHEGRLQEIESRYSQPEVAGSGGSGRGYSSGSRSGRGS